MHPLDRSVICYLKAYFKNLMYIKITTRFRNPFYYSIRFHTVCVKNRIQYFTFYIYHYTAVFKVALGVSPQFFSIWTRVLNHNKYVEIKQFSEEEMKQNNISTVILLTKFLVYQWDPRHLQGSRVVYIFIYTLYSCSI